MAKLPDIIDPTLAAVNAAIEAAQDTSRRPYLGASAIGDPCERKLWYSFNWAFRPNFDADTLRRFRDGHSSEDVQAADLRLVDGITLKTHTIEGGQFGFQDIHGHFRGHYDGMITGLLQAPKVKTIWEHKAVGEKSQAKLQKLKAEKGEKNALKEWNETYYGQAQVYMRAEGLTRHYLTASSPGCRTTISCRTDYNAADANALFIKAERIIATDKPPIGISQDPAFYLCKWCDASDICYGDKIPEMNCRTCVFSRPANNGQWYCEDQDIELNPAHQELGCNRHLYTPALIPAEQVGASEEHHAIQYKRGDVEFWNGPKGELSYTSEELQHLLPDMIGDIGIEAMREQFDGVVVSKREPGV
ncbi:MAG: hypothetical protein ACSHWQ_02510 [Spongiibacteraceae bacterium]